MKKMALILQGGGALGAFEYGAVSRLVELGWQPVAVTGVSIGAINSAAIAGARNGDICASLKALWNAITLPDMPWLPQQVQAGLATFGNPNFYRLRTDYLNMANWVSFCSTAPMVETLNRICDFKQINDHRHMRIAVNATDLQNGSLTTFANYLPNGAVITDAHASHQTTLDAAHILASGSLPPGFPATEIKDQQGRNRAYWDGGLFSNTPVDALLDMLDQDEIESLPIFVLDLFPNDLPVPTDLAAVQNRMQMMQYQNRFWAEYGGSAKLAGYLKMLDDLDQQLPANSPVRREPAFQWLLRHRALKNLNVITYAASTMAGCTDFSSQGVSNAYQCGHKAVDDYFASHGESKPAKKLKLA